MASQDRLVPLQDLVSRLLDVALLNVDAGVS
jgi:hypothetical protein